MKWTLTELPQKTSAAHLAPSSDKNLLSYPIITGLSCFDEALILSHNPCPNYCIFVLVNSSPIIALHPPVPN
jgi:hypothetical protein